jgi:hypothetical protein
MEPVLIPNVPREAFNKHRPISDLVRKQVEHFKHIEQKLPHHVREKLPQHAITTEDEAARYISVMTSHLLGPRLKQVAKKAIAVKPPAPPLPSPPLALAAAAAPAREKSAAKKKITSKEETPAVKKSPSIKPNPRETSAKRKR